MRFLLDEGMSPLVLDVLVAAGHDAVHVRDIGLKSASDELVMAEAVSADSVLVTLDTDFGTLLAFSGAGQPSTVLFRGEVTRRPGGQAVLLLANLDQVSDDLAAGAIVVIGDQRVRVRQLPIAGPDPDESDHDANRPGAGE